MPFDEMLKRNCIIDTSLLSNFVFTGYAHLLEKLVNGPVLIAPAVLDPSEITLPINHTVVPRCEFLKPLYEIHGTFREKYKATEPFIESFASSAGKLWQPIELTEAELFLARRMRLREIWKETKDVEPRFTKRGLGAGEAEACAVAVKRNWTLLIDDQPAIELLRGLGHSVPHVRTCKLLKHAVERDHIPCEEAMHLFNREIVDKFGFHATRSKGAERLWFRCKPPGCIWDAA